MRLLFRTLDFFEPWYFFLKWIVTPLRLTWHVIFEIFLIFGKMLLRTLWHIWICTWRDSSIRLGTQEVSCTSSLIIIEYTNPVLWSYPGNPWPLIRTLYVNAMRTWIVVNFFTDIHIHIPSKPKMSIFFPPKQFHKAQFRKFLGLDRRRLRFLLQANFFELPLQIVEIRRKQVKALKLCDPQWKLPKMTASIGKIYYI